jgi:signal transduction histidine kinase
VWLRDKARWRDFGFLAFSGTGGLAMSGLPPLLLVTPVVHLVGAVVEGGVWWLLLAISSVAPVVWWAVTPALVRSRAVAERSILGHSRVEQLEQRVEEVAGTRAAALDHSAAEVRRIERDLHDGAQARIAAVGMNVGLAEKLMITDPVAAAGLLREARETTVSALEDLRSVVRGIHPPVLADRGLAGAVEALVVPIPLPVTMAVDLPAGLPAPVESALYFAVAECLANVVKHSGASRAWVSGSHDGALLRLVVGDDGAGGADPSGSGLAGVARRLSSFDGRVGVVSPVGGPTVVTLEVPCRTSG